MKHLLNDLSIEEKNRIREQHEGGITIDSSKFRKLMETKLGDVKPLIMELNFHPSAGGSKLNSMGVQKGTWKKLTDKSVNIYYRDKTGKNIFFKSLEFEPEYQTDFAKVKINQVGNWELTGGNEISLSY